MLFRSILDPRPLDSVWPAAVWPPVASAVLTGDYVELRRSEPSDGAELFAALDDAEVWRHLRSQPNSAADVTELISQRLQTDGWFPWTVRLLQPIAGLKEGAIVGTTSFMDCSPLDARVEIGSTSYARSVWGTAVNPDCKLLLLQFAFEQQIGRAHV